MQTEESYYSVANENIVSQLWAKYFPYWPVFLLLSALSCGGAWLYLMRKLPVYEASATILIKDEKKGSEESKMLESLNLLSSKKIVENEIEVIKSRALMTEVVKELKLYAPVFRVGRWADAPAYGYSPVSVEAQNPDSLVEASHIAFRYDANANKVRIGEDAYPVNQWIATRWGILRFGRFAVPADDHQTPLYFSLLNPKRAVQSLSQRLSVTAAGKLSSVVNLKIKDEAARRAEDILNALIAAYDKAALRDKNRLAANTLSFLDDRLNYISSGLDSIERSMQQYRSEKGAVDISTQGQLFLKNVSDNDQKLSEANMKLAVLNQIERSIFSNDGQNALVPTTLGFDEPVLTNLLNKLYELDLQYERLKKTTGENNPEALTVADQIQKIKPSIVENIRSQRRSLEINKANLYSTNNGYNALLRALPQQERDLVEISREQNIKSSIYSYLLQRREEAALSHSAVVSDSRVVDKAESSLEPVGIGGKLIYPISIFLALGLGVTVIVARETLSGKVMFRDELEAATSFPVIGEIAAVKTKLSVVVEENANSFVAEQFRHLRTSLPYLGVNGRGKKILVTSTISGEGKSFVAVNLALSIALAGNKVAIVEFDLSNPSLGDKLSMQSPKGVADFLKGDTGIEEIIRSVDDSSNLFFLPSGKLPKNPSELILSSRTEKLLTYLQDVFDYVIVDCAPVGLLSDGYVLAKHCDATLFIVRHRHTPKKMLERLVHNNRVNKLTNLGIVFNYVQKRGFGFTRHGYGYGYGQAYTYTFKQKERRRPY